MTRYPTSRRGFTMVEMAIATLILVSVLAGVLSVSTSTVAFSYMVDTDMEVQSEVDRTRSTIGSDLFLSGVLLRYDNVSHAAADPDGTGPLLTDPQMPKILQMNREIRFARLRTSTISTGDPLKDQASQAGLAQNVGVRLNELSASPPSPFFILNPDGGEAGSWYIGPVWESNKHPLSFEDNNKPDNLRLYRYVLVPDNGEIVRSSPDAQVWAETEFPDISRGAGPIAGTLRVGQLLRQYRNAGSDTWTTVGNPLAHGIQWDNFQITNNSIEPTLTDNQIRFRMVIHRPAQRESSWPTRVYPVDIIAAMQTITYGE